MARALQIGDEAVFAQCDVTNEEQLAAAVDLATSKFGRLDVMVNNAGANGVATLFTTLSLDLMRQI